VTSEEDLQLCIARAILKLDVINAKLDGGNNKQVDVETSMAKDANQLQV
jgi:hypothetical protein